MSVTYVTATELSEETNLSYYFILQCCRSSYGRQFAKPTRTDRAGRCTGKYIINKEKFIDYFERGLLTD